MTRDEAIARLKQSESMLKEAGVTHLYLFGSTVRGEARPDHQQSASSPSPRLARALQATAGLGIQNYIQSIR